MKIKTLSQEKRLYQCPLPIVGVSGGIATGKSTVSSLLKSWGHSIICADQLIKNIYQENETIALISRVSPDSIEGTQINFSHLRKFFFSHKKEQMEIENHLYARLPEQFMSCAHSIIETNNPKLIIYDVPLMYEKGLQKVLDADILVYCPVHLQRERIKSRDGSDDQTIENILKKQMPIDDKRKGAQFIIENTSSLEILEKNTKEVLDKII